MKNSNKKLISLFLGMMLIVAMALCTTGCGKDEITDENIGRFYFIPILAIMGI